MTPSPYNQMLLISTKLNRLNARNLARFDLLTKRDLPTLSNSKYFYDPRILRQKNHILLGVMRKIIDSVISFYGFKNLFHRSHIKNKENTKGGPYNQKIGFGQKVKCAVLMVQAMEEV